MELYKGYDVSKAEDDYKHATEAAIDLLRLLAGSTHESLIKQIERNIHRAMCEYDYLISKKWEAYEIFNKLSTYACWANDPAELTKEQLKKTKVLLDAIQMDDRLGKEVRFDKWSEDIENRYHAKKEKK